MGENTIGYLTINECAPKILTAVQNDLTSLSGRLLQYALINAEQNAQLTHVMQDKLTRANLLVTFVRTKVSGNEENYSIFVNKVLGANRAYYRDLIEHIERIEEKYRESE